jgi:hypothetical protein
MNVRGGWVTLNPISWISERKRLYLNERAQRRFKKNRQYLSDTAIRSTNEEQISPSRGTVAS